MTIAPARTGHLTPTPTRPADVVPRARVVIDGHLINPPAPLVPRTQRTPATRPIITPARAAVAAAGTTAVAGVGYAGYLAVMWAAANWALLLGIGVTALIVLAVLARIGGGCVLNIVCKTHR